MTEQRKNLYRKLLYTAMIDLRGHSYKFSWQKLGAENTLSFINSLTDWLHNLTLYASQDFTEFDEELFWQHYQSFRDEFPIDKWGTFLEGTVNQLKK